MSEIVVRMEHVYKKFRKGEVFNSLRDFLPALTGKMFRQSDLNQSDKREFWALQDLSFEVKAGECFGIIGHNGAGKSTALKILSRIMKPTKGTMIVNGRLSALIEVSAGFHQDLTGRENIFLNGAILGMSRREIQTKLDQIIAFSGIEEFIDTPVKRYSSGMYARLGFSVAAHVDPDVLIVDEVLSVGDYAFQQKCIKRMKEVLRSGAAVLFVSHNLKTVTDFCDRCLLLDKGHTVATGSTRQVVSQYLQPASRAESGSEFGPVTISSVTIRGEHGEAMQFQPGDKAWVDVEVKARTRCTKLSVTLYILDESLNEIFDASTDVLGHDEFTLEEGDVYSCTIEVSLNLVDGTYYPSVNVYRRDIQTLYTKREPAATIYIGSDGAVRGTAHCFPRVIHQEIRRAQDLNLFRNEGGSILERLVRKFKIRSSKLQVGDWVEVQSREEILLTLDRDGRLDGMPFMPEMFAFCGKRFQVYKRAHKTCDTVFPVRGRRVHSAVHLDTRCDGSAHGGCQASCLLFWKDAWLKPLGGKSAMDAAANIAASGTKGHNEGSSPECTERNVADGTLKTSGAQETPIYVCQATQLPYATSDLQWWDIRQYIEDYISGNVGLWRLLSGGVYFLSLWFQQAGIGIGRPIRWFYDNFYRLWGGAPFPRRRGSIPAGERTPGGSLGLQPGELVRIKPYKEILSTLDTRNRNRGLYFDAEEVPYCGRTYRVQKSVTKIVNERTGKMQEMKSPCVILDSVICESRYSECRLFCPRSIYPYWREIWLERVESNPANARLEEEDFVVKGD